MSLQPHPLDGVRMRAVSTGSNGDVDANTLFEFGQQGATVWARYSGGSIEVGYLDRRGEVHGGRSVAEMSPLPDGRIQMLEHFQWESRAGSGTNVLEEVSR